jgi:hypothetical protein
MAMNRSRHRGVDSPSRPFHDIDWGSDDGRSDPKLPTYFVKIPAYESLIVGEKRYIIGRKGTGKTALIERIRIAAQQEHKDTWHISDLSLRNFPLQLVRDLRDSSYHDKSQYVPVWTFLIAVELARLVTADTKILQNDHSKVLRRFLSDNFDSHFAGFSDTAQRLKERSGLVQLSAYGATGALGGKSSAQASFTRNYHEATRLLFGSLSKIACTSSYYVLIDDLDEGFKVGDSGIRLLLLALLRAVEDVTGQLARADAHYRVVLALRDDIFDSLEDSDLNKLDDYVFRLRWSARSTDGLSLRDVVAARIRASVDVGKSMDPWPLVVRDDDPDLPPSLSSMWGYMMNRTYERPRDIVKFLKYCRSHVPTRIRLRYVHAVAAENDYSDWLYRELRDEIQSFLPVWKEAFQALSQITLGVVPVDKLKAQLEANPAVASWLKENNKTPDAVLVMLFDYGVIGSFTDRRVWSFKYKDHSLAWNPMSTTVVVHWGLVKKLRIVRALPLESA